MGTSLWLVPSASSSEATALQEVITSLSRAHLSPCFHPHITLASLPMCISLTEITACLSSEEQLEILFETVRTGKTFFQSVFVVAQMSPALAHLHDHVHKTLGVQPKTPEFAHLSLYYGDEGKEDILRRLRADRVVCTIEGQNEMIKGISKLLVEEVWVVNCNGKPEDWDVIEKVPLKSQILADRP